jgi:hypothetical protein
VVKYFNEEDSMDKEKRDKSECNTCLWASCECSEGSMFKTIDDIENKDNIDYGTLCIAWTYYD